MKYERDREKRASESEKRTHCLCQAIYIRIAIAGLRQFQYRFFPVLVQHREKDKGENAIKPAGKADEAEADTKLQRDW